MIFLNFLNKTRNVDKLLAEAMRKKQKLLKKKREQSPGHLKKLVKKYEENSEKLKSQTKKLNELRVLIIFYISKFCTIYVDYLYDRIQ